MSTPNQNAIVFFGKTPNERQEVAPELKTLGIPYLRQEPSAVSWSGAPTTIQANYSLYSSHISQFMVSAWLETPCSLTGNAFRALGYKGNGPYIPYPEIVINWSIALPEEVADDLRSKGWRDVTVRGKACMAHRSPSIEKVKEARATKCLDTSPTVENQMNISTFRVLLQLQRIVGVFVKTNQYPAFIDEDHESEYNKLFGAEDKMDEDVEMPGQPEEDGVEEGSARKKQKRTAPKERVYPVNLPIPFDEAPLSVDHSFKPTASGVIFRYHNDLAVFDAKTVPQVVNRRFYHLLGDDEESAEESYTALKAGFGTLYKTEAGKQLSHMFKCIDLALHLQTQVIPLIPKLSYSGMIMLGAGYTLTVNNRPVEIVEKEDLSRLIQGVDDHSRSLWSIFSKLKFRNDEERTEQYRRTTRMVHLKALFDSMSIGGSETRSEVEKLLPHVDFNETPYAVTAENIVEVLRVMSDNTISLEQLPYIHHSLLFSMNRRHICWSAFGENAPSLRVPTGKAMSITSKFQVSFRLKNGETKIKPVSKLGLLIVDLAQALAHLDTVFEKREVLNPFGNQQVKTSDNSAFKIIESAGTEKVLAAFRAAIGVKTVTDEPSGSKKRKGTGDAGSSSKKAKIHDDFD